MTVSLGHLDQAGVPIHSRAEELAIGSGNLLDLWVS